MAAIRQRLASFPEGSKSSTKQGKGTHMLKPFVILRTGMSPIITRSIKANIEDNYGYFIDQKYCNTAILHFNIS